MEIGVNGITYYISFKDPDSLDKVLAMINSHYYYVGMLDEKGFKNVEVAEIEKVKY
mgnify:CR=1 FL=1